MEIKESYRCLNEGINYYVYSGMCDNRATKWITKNKWNYKIKVSYKEGLGLLFTDSKGDIIDVLEKEDPEDAEKWRIMSRQEPDITLPAELKRIKTNEQERKRYNNYTMEQKEKKKENDRKRYLREKEERRIKYLRNKKDRINI